MYHFVHQTKLMNFSSITLSSTQESSFNRDTLFVPFKAPVTTLAPSICKLCIANYYQIQNIHPKPHQHILRMNAPRI